MVTRRSGTFVLDAKPEFRQLARRQLASDSSDLNASPAVCGGRIYPRSDERLCCAGAAKS
ncbi:MAG: hypothetical protein JXA90_07765 [Planctomycetes bacterium]|nr:hypothetical protein [Planctomycetota bacterium]